MSNYIRAKVLSSPKGENDTYAKCKHLHSLCKTAKKRERESMENYRGLFSNVIGVHIKINIIQLVKAYCYFEVGRRWNSGLTSLYHT